MKLYTVARNFLIMHVNTVASMTLPLLSCAIFVTNGSAMDVGTPLDPTSSTIWCEPSIRKLLYTGMAHLVKLSLNAIHVVPAMSLC